jgi:hypothetical protein
MPLLDPFLINEMDQASMALFLLILGKLSFCIVVSLQMAEPSCVGMVKSSSETDDIETGETRRLRFFSSP